MATCTTPRGCRRFHCHPRVWFAGIESIGYSQMGVALIHDAGWDWRPASMPPAYSLGLGERVVAAVMAGQSRQAVASIFGVSVASVVKWSGRDFAAWLGIVPRQDSTAGKPKLGPISKQGDRYLRRLYVIGAMAVLRRARAHLEVADAASGAQAAQSCGSGARQQDGTHGVGAHGQGRDLSCTGHRRQIACGRRARHSGVTSVPLALAHQGDGRPPPRRRSPKWASERRRLQATVFDFKRFRIG
jgi:Transposase IS116/IS110/IS902 family